MDHAFAAIVEDSVSNALNEDTENTLTPTTSMEAQNCISGLKKNKSPGGEQNSTNMFIHLPQIFIFYIALFINNLLQLNKK